MHLEQSLSNSEAKRRFRDPDLVCPHFAEPLPEPHTQEAINNLSEVKPYIYQLYGKVITDAVTKATASPLRERKPRNLLKGWGWADLTIDLERRLKGSINDVLNETDPAELNELRHLHNTRQKQYPHVKRSYESLLDDGAETAGIVVVGFMERMAKVATDERHKRLITDPVQTIRNSSQEALRTTMLAPHQLNMIMSKLRRNNNVIPPIIYNQDANRMEFSRPLDSMPLSDADKYQLPTITYTNTPENASINQVPGVIPIIGCPIVSQPRTTEILWKFTSDHLSERGLV